MKKLLNQNVNVTIYAGDTDFNFNGYGGQVVSQEVGARNLGKADFVTIEMLERVLTGLDIAIGTAEVTRGDIKWDGGEHIYGR